MSQSLIEILIKATDKASGPIDAVKKKLDGLNETQAQNVSLTEAFGGVMSGFASGLASSAATIGAAGAIMKQAFDLAEAGAMVERMQEASSNLAVSMGSDMGDIVAAVKAASLGTVSDLDIMAAASRAMMLGISADADELANLMEVAAFRARAMGITTTQAFSDIVTGIGRQSPLILDNLGIVVDTVSMYEDYAASLGKTADQLTEAEKKQALLNEVLQTGNEMLEAAGGLTADAASQYEEFGAHIKNAKDEGLSWLEDFVTPTVTVMNEWMTFTEALTRAQEAGIVTQAEANAMMVAAKGSMFDLSGATDDLNRRMQAQVVHQEELIASFGDTIPAAVRATEANTGLSDSYSVLATAINTAAVSEEEWQSAIDVGLHNDLTAALQESSEAFDDLANKIIFATASQDLNAQSQLALARSLGLIDEAAYQTALATQTLTDEYIKSMESGTSAAQATADFTSRVQSLKYWIQQLEGKNIDLVLNLIVTGNQAALSYLDAGGIATQQGFNINLLSQGGVTMAKGGAFDVPAGYPNDSYGPIWLQSGEHVEVTPAGQTPRSEMMANITIPIYLDGEEIFSKSFARQLKSQGVLA